MSLEETQANKLSVIFGQQTKEVTLPDGKVYKIHPLKFNQLCELEEYINIPISDWAIDNPFRKLKSMLFTIYLSLKKNPDFKMTKDDLGEIFDLGSSQVAGQIINEILLMSGIRNTPDDTKGNDQGAPVQ